MRILAQLCTTNCARREQLLLIRHGPSHEVLNVSSNKITIAHKGGETLVRYVDSNLETSVPSSPIKQSREHYLKNRLTWLERGPFQNFPPWMSLQRIRDGIDARFSFSPRPDRWTMRITAHAYVYAQRQRKRVECITRRASRRHIVFQPLGNPHLFRAARRRALL